MYTYGLQEQNEIKGACTNNKYKTRPSKTNNKLPEAVFFYNNTKFRVDITGQMT